jgi:hypothetical protein
MSILLCPLVLVVNIDNGVSTETCLICKEHWRNKHMLNTSQNKTQKTVLSRSKISSYKTLHSSWLVRAKQLFMQYLPNGHERKTELFPNLSRADTCIQINMEDILSAYYERILSVTPHKLNVSGHMLIWTLSLVLLCGTRAQSLCAPFSYTPYRLRYFDHCTLRADILYMTVWNVRQECLGLLWLLKAMQQQDTFPRGMCGMCPSRFHMTWTVSSKPHSPVKSASVNKECETLACEKRGRSSTCVRFEVTVKIAVFWDVKPWSLVDAYQRLCCPHRQDKKHIPTKRL